MVSLLGRKWWTWHSDARREFERASCRGDLTGRIAVLSSRPDTIRQRQLFEPARGRLLKYRFGPPTDHPWVVLLVERADRKGYGALLLHECASRSLCPPEGAHELALRRLAEMPHW